MCIAADHRKRRQAWIQRARQAAGVLLLATATDVSGHQLDAHAPADLTTRPAVLTQGVGREYILVDAPSVPAAALDLYAQGLAQLHGYRWIEAARAFHTALRIAPDFLLPQLGLVRAYEGMKDQEKADEHLQQALALSAQANARDAGLAEAMRWRRQAHRPGRGGQQAHRAYRAALDRLLEKHPKDVEILLLRGNASEAVAWGKGMAGGEESLVFYEAAIELAPQHPGARHYLAHSYENLERYFEAASQAARFARLAPRVPHARHMYAHTLPRIGKWATAVEELEAADGLEREYFREEGIPARADWHRVHNLSLLGLAYLRTGRPAAAERVLQEAFETPVPDPQTVSWHTIWPEFLLIADRNAEAAAAARRLIASDHSISQIVGTALLGESFLSAGDPEAATRELAEARRKLAQYLSTEARTHPMGMPLGWVAEEYLQILVDRLYLHQADANAPMADIEERTQRNAARPGLDGWGAGWLRILRLEKQARLANRIALADRLATLGGGAPVPLVSDAPR